MVIMTSTVCQQNVVSMLTAVWGDIGRPVHFFFLGLSISLTLTFVYERAEAAKDELFWFLESSFKER